MPVEHKLKTWPIYWDAVARGEKNFEARRDDRGFQKGDILVLERFEPKYGAYTSDPEQASKRMTLRKRVTYILTGGQFGIEPGWVVMSLEDE